MSDNAETSRPFYEDLTGDEEYWRDKYQWLLDSGYKLRPRYHPEWVPSWKKDTRLDPILCEDVLVNNSSVICDASRIKDGSLVVLKRVSQIDHPDEISIVEYLMEEPQKSDPRNHCMPLTEILQPAENPTERILVMSLCSRWDSPEFETLGEAVDCIRQILEGVHFLHDHRIAHRDLKNSNIMMSTSLYSEQFHPVRPDRSQDFTHSVSPRFSRTQRPPRYYIIDYGLARRYDASETPPMEQTGIFGSDFTVPEFNALDKPHNPFPIDVYCLGNVIQNDVLGGEAEELGFGWILPLLRDMTAEDPNGRPSISEVVSRFDAEVASLKVSTLRAKYALSWGEMEWHEKLAKTVPYLFRRIRFVLTRTPPIPGGQANRSTVPPLTG